MFNKIIELQPFFILLHLYFRILKVIPLKRTFSEILSNFTYCFFVLFCFVFFIILGLKSLSPFLAPSPTKKRMKMGVASPSGLGLSNYSQKSCFDCFYSSLVFLRLFSSYFTLHVPVHVWTSDKDLQIGTKRIKRIFKWMFLFQWKYFAKCEAYPQSVRSD